MVSIRKCCGVLVLVWAMVSGGLFAKNPTVPPDVLRVAPVGAQRGSTVRVIVEGRNLAEVWRVLFSAPGMKAEVVNVDRLPKKEAVDDDGVVIPAVLYEAPSYRVTLKVSIASMVPPGVHSFRLLTPLGITERVSFAVGEWTEVKESSEMSGKAAWAELPATLVGTLETPGEVDEFQFYAREGQELVFQTTAAKIGSALEPILEVLDAQGNKVGGKSVAANRDAVLGIAFTTEGRYTLRISDYEMRGGQDFHYRVTAGELPYLTRVFPLGVRKGEPTEVRLEGFNLAGVESVTVQPPASAGLWDTFETRVTTPKGKSLNPIRLAVGEYPEILEKEAGSGLASAIPVQIPVVINGRIDSGPSPGPSDEDLFRFKARKGQKMILEVEADRLGSPLDSLLEVLDSKGRPIPRTTLRAVLKTSVIFRSHDSVSPDIRMDTVKGLGVGDYILIEDEVMQVERLPEQPDEDHHFRRFMGRRFAAFGTTSTAHPLDAPAYKVVPHPAGTTFPPNGLPVVTLSWRNDDGGPMLGKDSRLAFTAPENGLYHVRLRDVQGLEGPDRAYRLTLREPNPDFKLMAGNPMRLRRTPDPRNSNVPRGGTIPIQVVAQRLDGFDGPIEVELLDLPKGLSASPAVIASGQDSTVLALSASPGASLHAEGVAPLKIVGRARIGSRPVLRYLEPDKKLNLIALMPGPDVEIAVGAKEVVLQPGQEKRIPIQIERVPGFEERVPFQIANLPPGVVVVNLGLNGINIAEKEKTAEFWLRAVPAALPADQIIWVTGRIESNNTILLAGPPLRLKVHRAMLARSADDKDTR